MCAIREHKEAHCDALMSKHFPTLKGLLAASPLILAAAIVLKTVEDSSAFAGALTSGALLVFLLVWLYFEGTRE